MLLRHLYPLASLLLLAAPLHAEPVRIDYPVRADRVLLLNVTDNGKHLVAVGERGVVLLGNELGAQWTSVRTDTTRTLSGVAFATADIGVAVGHGGTLLRTEDGGQHWQALEADTNGDALLGVAALGDGRLAAWGAFGLYLLSTDNGASWERRTVGDADFDRHIAQIIRLANGDWLMVGESGTLLRSTDSGQTWQTQQSPYAGSLFGALQTRGGDILIYGMRGNLWASADGGQTWNKRDTDTTFAFNGAAQLGSGRILAFGNSGMMLASDDQGHSFQRLPSTRANLARALQLTDGRLLAVGDRGVMTLDLRRQE